MPFKCHLNDTEVQLKLGLPLRIQNVDCAFKLHLK